uniref:BTB domain-containing protein n=1 Tax=Oryza barthii TaxID=65489 RepID=A0A0D3GX92_9ORYZ
MGASFSSNLTDAARAVHMFKINGYSATKAMARTDSLPSRRLPVGSYHWEVRYTASLIADSNHWVALKLVLLAAPRHADVKAALRCRLISNNWIINVRAGESSAWVLILRRSALEASGAIVDDAFTVECTITVITEIPDNVVAAAAAPANVLPRFSGRALSLSHHLGVLLRRGTGADFTLVVSGKCFPAHRAILASRSPVFMASLFGDMKEKSSRSVEIRDIEPQVFGAMLGFIYTDSLDQQDGVVVAQHLLAAADMCGLDGLKIMCEEKLIAGATVETAATTLALAEQHGCPRLKARCVEVVAANLDAVMATEGYKHLMASSPLVMNDLLRASNMFKKVNDVKHFEPEGVTEGVPPLHLLAAADMCGLDGLKIMCEEKLIAGATVETAATTLALAEQHACPRLKARCVELVAANLDAVMATEGYKHLSWRARRWR